MRKLVEAVLEDLSSTEVFRFRVVCGNCGSEYGNKPLRFSKSVAPSAFQEGALLHRALYEQELSTAKRIAIRNAAEHMNYCPVCERLVCNQCFLICDDLDLCIQCATRLEQHGTPVLPSFFEAD